MKRIAILRDDHLGDMILTTSLARTLHAQGYEVEVVGKAAWADVWAGNPDAGYQSLDRICPQWPVDWRNLSVWLKEGGFTHLLIPLRSKPLLWASFFSGVQNRYAQFSGVWGRLTLHRCLPSRIWSGERHLSDIWLDFARALECQDLDPRPRLHLEDSLYPAVRKKIFQDGSASAPLVVIHPFHGKSTCHPGLPVYAELVRIILKETHWKIAVTGSKTERQQWENVFQEEGNPRFWNSCGELDLKEFFAVIGTADCLVCGSTGALHVSSALDRPSVSIFCPHPSVGPVLWKSFAGSAEILCPGKDQCGRYRNPPVFPCGMPSGPDASEIFSRVRKVIAAGQGRGTS